MPMLTRFGLDHKDSRLVPRISRRKSKKRVLKHSRRRCYGGGGRKKNRAAVALKAVAERLEVLRSLIPAKNGRVKEKKETAEGDMLFEETTEYILLLRTQEVLRHAAVSGTPRGFAEHPRATQAEREVLPRPPCSRLREAGTCWPSRSFCRHHDHCV
ncbi:hypothetical protein Cni_G14025 [Canna indica]|uniref:Uncharacterized protein n=1 Tax=Canna indica TaxID=4628 RepID=A0AAQ3KFL8_9LILI|nr:hypothetical protein Cni_G14025 [Canna indica]